MKPVMLRLLLLLFLVPVVTSCSPYYTEGEFFFVRSADADLPVWVRGNSTSSKFVIFLHGGPGGSAMDATLLPAMKELEKDFRLVYWDQRASGISQGNATPETLTMEQFVQDTDVIVEVIRKRYKPSKLFLLGHSWGGALGVAYLAASKAHQKKFNGFLMVDAGHNLLEGLPKSAQWVNAYAVKKRKEVSDKEEQLFWQEAIDWYKTQPDMTVPENYFRHERYLHRSPAFQYNLDSPRISPDSDLIFNSFNSLAKFFNPMYLNSHFNILKMNLEPKLASITLPTWVLWGKHDGINLVEMGQKAFTLLGTPSTQKKLVLFEKSAHEPFREEKELFVKTCLDFLNSN